MLRQANQEIQEAMSLDLIRHRRQSVRRLRIRRLDQWLNEVETMLEEDRRTVPEPLVREIASFLRGVDGRLHRALLRNRDRNPSLVLDVLFDAQENVMPALAAESAQPPARLLRSA